MSTQPIEGTHYSEEMLSLLAEIKFMIQETQDKKQAKIDAEYESNLTRKDIIEMATEETNFLLSNSSRETIPGQSLQIINYDANIDWFEFQVDRRNRKVIAKQMVKHYHDNTPTVLHTATATCPENEKFNTAIGTIVALYKCLGKQVPPVYKNVKY